MIDRISNLMKLCDSEDTVMPPTILYNEGWMIRIILDWFSENESIEHPLSFYEGARWYSEILLPSPFSPRYRGDKLSEAYTHADGAIGHFTVGRSGKGDINLLQSAKQVVVIEAKMFSKLSHGITHFKEYDQATRNVACIAKELSIADIPVTDIPNIGFYVIAPKSQLDSESTFSKYLQKESINRKVKQRVDAYQGEDVEIEKKEWYNKWFVPTINKIDIKALSWEQIVEHIISIDSNGGHNIRMFYNKCIEYNRPSNKRLAS